MKNYETQTPTPIISKTLDTNLEYAKSVSNKAWERGLKSLDKFKIILNNPEQVQGKKN